MYGNFLDSRCNLVATLLRTFFVANLLHTTLTCKAACNKIVTTLWYSSCEETMLQIHGDFKLVSLLCQTRLLQGILYICTYLTIYISH